MGRIKLSVVLMLACVVKCLSMSYNELEDFADYLKKTSQLSPTLKKGVEPDDYDEDEAVSDHAWEDSGKFEGDLILNERQRRLIVENVAEGLSRNGIRDGTKRWPNNEVVYYIQVEHFTSDQVQAIQNGIDDLAQASCVKFRRYRKGDRDAVVIQGSRRGCFSQVGYQGGYQVLNLSGRHPVGRGCFRHGTVIHEMLHTLGFYHMQSSPDRDDYVNIVWPNIIQQARHNFRKYNLFSVSDFGVGYDYDSVLHYSRRAFSSNGQDTIVPKKGGASIGQRLGLSDKDTQKLNKMYCDADSDHVEAEEEAEEKPKKRSKNKPFEGHGIGYHQGKAVVIKLKPTAETYKLDDIPSSHVFDYFSKTPQILSTPKIEGFRAGKKITHSYNPPTPTVGLDDKKSIGYNSEHGTFDEKEIDPHKQQHQLEDENQAKINKAGEIPDKENSPDKSNEYEESQKPSLWDAFDRLSKIIKSHVYPSYTPDLTIYKAVNQDTHENSPEDIKKEKHNADTSTQLEKTKSAMQFINNLYDLNSYQAIKLLESQYHPKTTMKTYFEYEKKENNKKEALVANVPGDNDEIGKHKEPTYTMPFTHDRHRDQDISAPERDDDYDKYFSKIHDDNKSHEHHDDWYHSYKPHKYKPIFDSKEAIDFVKHRPSADEYDSEYYSSSVPERIKEYPYHDLYKSDKYNYVSHEDDLL